MVGIHGNLQFLFVRVSLTVLGVADSRQHEDRRSQADSVCRNTSLPYGHLHLHEPGDNLRTG
jgi:hypothetical protein